ncbi:alpha-ketoglutarate-dependent dioxygenase alkB homolog 7, mitochondrial [Parasteatoda tepidariorum]|nr:alpha-ketoglutarate-dependent dioxygenase alkB homolog 7, mitochondrial [Parasteatoda tepidariorum]
MLYSIFTCMKYQTVATTLHYLRSVSRNVENHVLNAVNYLSGEVTESVHKDFKLYANFLTEDEEIELMNEIDPIFKRRRYQFDHWDGAIEGYRETEKLEWNEKNSFVLQRVRELAFPSDTVPMKQIHILDLAKNGYIKPHVDSIKFCGDTIVGLSLLSSSVMRLVSEKNKNMVVDCLLPRRSLYVMKGSVRYDFTHEILGEKCSYFKGKLIAKDRRVSVICRNEPLS